MYLEPSVGVNPKIRTWSIVGSDITKSPLNYVDTYYLHAKRAQTLYAPYSEDLADIAVATECQDDCGCPIKSDDTPEKPNNHIDRHKKVNEGNNKTHSEKNKKQLPDTGDKDNNEDTLISLLISIIESLFIFDRHKYKRKSEN